MAVLMWPPQDEQPWPTLGPQIIDFLESIAVHGPGARAGQPLQLSDEAKYLICRHYEVYPRSHPRAGRRRFSYVIDEITKGTAKTETAALEVLAEIHPDGPVRADGWRQLDDGSGAWVPVGVPVHHPFVPMVSYTERQTEDQGFGVLKFIVEHLPGEDLKHFDPGLDRIAVLDPWGRLAGKAAPFAAAPDSGDGDLPTHTFYDELHRWTTPRLQQAHSTMQENLGKREADDPWAHAVSTMYTVGEGSVLEGDHDAAEQMVKHPETGDRSTFFFYRWAKKHRDDEDLDDLDQCRAAVREAKGPLLAGSWDNFDDQVERIVAGRARAKRQGKLWYWNRVQLNRSDLSELRPFDVDRWKALGVARPLPRDGSPICLGLDGSRYRDVTVLVATTVRTRWQWVAGYWIPSEEPGGEVPIDEVKAVGRDLARQFHIVRAYGDPAAGYRELLASWSGEWGPKKVAEFYTDSRGLRATAEMLLSYQQAQRNGEVTHSVDRRGDDLMTEHMGNAVKRFINLRDEDGEPMWIIRKEREDSGKKIDADMAGGMSYQAVLDAVAAGDPLEPAPAKTTGKVAATFAAGFN